MSEAEALFFVAISRAEQELVLTRAARYGKTDRGPSPLLALAAPFFAVNPPERIDRPAQPIADAPDVSTPAPITRVLHVAETERYLRCPRQYEYRHILDLREQDEVLGYKRCQQVVYRVLSQLRAWQGEGDLGKEARAMSHLTEEWDRGGPQGSPYEALYRDLAETIVHRTWQMLTTSPAYRSWRTHVDVEINGVTIRIPIDASNVDADGSINISRIHARARKDDDHTGRTLALLRAGINSELGEQAKVTITLEYPATGETFVAKENKRYEGQRIEKLAAAVTGIVEGRFPACPDSPWACHRCPFWIECPA